MMLNRRQLTAALALGAAIPVRAQAYPAAKPIRMLVGFAPGGSTDAAARLIAAELQKALKQTVIVENRPGAGGNIAAQQLYQAPPDGYTIMMGTFGAMAVNQFIYSMNFDPGKLLPIGKVADAYNVLVVPAASPYKSVRDLAIAKNIAYGSSGPGSAGHLCGVMFSEKTKNEMLHVAYKGGGPLLNSLLANEVAFAFATSFTTIPQLKAGKLRALGITSEKRIVALPEVKTMIEDGTAPISASNWHGLIAPAGTPTAIINQLNGVLAEILRIAEVKHKMEEHGLAAAASTPAEFGQFMDDERKRWGAIVRATGIRPE